MRINDYTLRNLRSFCAVVENGGPSGAQAVLGASLPSISTHLKDLETVLGFSLCQRGRGGFALTDKGAAVYREAKQMLGAVELAEANLGQLRHVLTGHLRVGLVDSESANPHLPVHRAIRRFYSRAQDVRLNLEIGTPEALSRALQTGEIQLAVGPFPNRQPNIAYTSIWTEDHALYCGAAHPLFAQDRITRDDLAPHAFAARPYLNRAELAALREPRVTASVSNMEAQAVLIRSGCFLGFLPLHFAAPWVDSGQMRRIAGFGWQSPFHVALRIQPEPPEIARIFARDLIEALA